MAIGQPDELDELIDFLVDKRPGIRGQAAELILGLTGSPEGLDRLKAKTNKLLVFTLRLLGETDEGVSKTVLSALVNMAHDKDLSQALVKQNVVNRCMDYLKERTCKHPRLLVSRTVNAKSNNSALCADGASTSRQSAYGCVCGCTAHASVQRAGGSYWHSCSVRNGCTIVRVAVCALQIMLLNNLTACSEDACNQLMQLGQEKLQGLNL